MQTAGLPAPVSGSISLSRHYSQVARLLRSFMPPTCHGLSQEDVTPIGGHPVTAGGFADIWEAMYDGRKVVLKSYRCYVMFDVLHAARVRCIHHPFNPSAAVDASQRYYNEVYICNLLHHEGVGVVVLLGLYSTEAHPFGLIYEYMDGLDLKQYLKNEPYVGRLKLVHVSSHAFSIAHLMLPHSWRT